MSTPTGPRPDPSGQYPAAGGRPPAGPPPGNRPPAGPPPTGGYRPPGPGTSGPGTPSGSPPHAPGTGVEPGTDPGRPIGFDDKGRVRRGKISATYVSLILATVVLILLIIFIAQNLNDATIHYLGASGSLPLGLLLLIAAIAGVLITAIPGTIRILQLRKALKRNTPLDQRTPDHPHGTQ